MSVLTCRRCGTTAPEHFAACPKCHALFHEVRLTELVRSADTLEASGALIDALAKLREMEPLLPSASNQAATVRARIAALEGRTVGTPGARAKAPRWVAALGAFGLAAWKLGAPLVALLSKGKLLLVGLLKLPTLLTFFASAALWSDSTNGIGLALVVLGSVYVHEMGHTFAFQRYGITVSSPMFVPGLGAFVRGSHYPKSAAAIGDVALSGPLWGAVTGVLVLVVGAVLHQQWLCGAAVIIAEINLFNLLPVWQLDGSRAAACLSARQQLALGVVAVAGAVLVVSPMAGLVGAGLLVRRFWSAPPSTGDRRTFYVFLSLIVGLLGLRVLAQALTTA